MATDDFPLIDNPHAPTRLADSESANTPSNTDYYPAFAESDPDKSGSGAPPTPSSKRNSQNNHQLYHNKRQKPSNAESEPSNNGSTMEHQRGSEYRKDREEWSDMAITRLLEAYTEKYKQLNRGNLRGRDWEEVAEAVSEGGGGNGNGKKSVEQCKNKIDNLKKRYKVELQRIGSTGSESSWHWFKHIEGIVGHSSSNSGGGKVGGVNVGGVSVESDVGGGVSVGISGGGGSGGNGSLVPCRQTKRYTPGSAAFVNNMKVKLTPSLKWKRVVFKISGSALAGNSQNVDPKVALQIAREVATACRIGLEVAIVLGGRNFFCGETWISSTGLERTTAYQIGMMATVMNSILLQSALEKLGVQSRVQSAFPVPELAELYSRQRAIRHLEKGRVVIFGGVGAGAGNPLFTTDTAAALRASELNADALLKGTNVDGIYDCPSGNGSIILDHVSFREAVSMSMTSMDVMAITYCEENEIPVVIFNLQEPGNISRALCGDQVGTLIDQGGRIS